MLGILSMLNWAMAALYGSVAVVVLMIFPLPLDAAIVVGLILLSLAIPHAYLGMYVEKGRGRILQTIFAMLGLFNVPLGTLFSVFALWVCWGIEKERFDHPDEAEPLETKPPRELERERLDDSDEEAPAERERFDPDDTPYDLAVRLKKAGERVPAIQQQLVDRGLDDEEIETILNAVGLRAGRPPARAKVKVKARR